MTAQSIHYGDLTDIAILNSDSEGEVVGSYVQGAWGLVEQRAGEATSFPLRDAHGDITTIADAEGEVASRQAYDPWGVQLSGPSLEMGWLGAQQRPTDSTTGLVQMGVRSYGPGLGGFLSEDPEVGHIGIGATTNRYAYAWNNPLNLYDLNGRDVCLFGGCASDVVDTGDDIIDGGVGYANHVASFWSDRYRDFVKSLKESCDASFGQRALDNFRLTNEAVPGLIAPTLSSAAINKWGKVAEKYGTTSPLEWLRKSRVPAELPRVVRAAAASWVYASLAWEAGVGIGSLARAALAEIYC